MRNRPRSPYGSPCHPVTLASAREFILTACRREGEQTANAVLLTHGIAGSTTVVWRLASGHSIRPLTKDGYWQERTQLLRTTQYSTSSSTPQPMTLTMWLIVGLGLYCLKMPPASLERSQRPGFCRVVPPASPRWNQQPRIGHAHAQQRRHMAQASHGNIAGQQRKHTSLPRIHEGHAHHVGT